MIVPNPPARTSLVAEPRRNIRSHGIAVDREDVRVHGPLLNVDVSADVWL